MKHFILQLSLISILFTSCTQNESNNAIADIPSKQKMISNALNYKDGAKPSNRLFPDKLRDLPNEITASHYPNPCYATFEDSMYIWKHNTTIQTNEDLQIIEYGSFVFTENGWYLRTVMTAKEFEQYYNCKDGLLKKGIKYTDNASWKRSNQLIAGDAVWYYIAKDKNGRLVKGTAPIETEGRLINASSRRATIVTSEILWTGYGEIGGYSLTGKIKLKDANIEVDGDSLKAATILIDMASINHDDKNLESHLKNLDFFDVSKYATAAFETVRIENLNKTSAIAVGNLTIKGITLPMTIPLSITKKGSNKTLKAKMSIDRTKYGIKYNSKSFFGDLGDQAIKNNFILEFMVEIL